MEEGNARIIKNSLWLYIRMFIVTLISLYTSRVVLKVLGFEDYGIYNLAGGVVAFLSILTGTMTNSTQRFLNKEKAVGNADSMSRLIQISVQLHRILAWVILFASETIGLAFVCFVLKIPQERYFAAILVYQASVVALIFSILQIPFNSVIITYEKFSFIALTGLADVIIKLLLVVGIVFIPFDKLIFYGFSLASASVVQLVWYKYYSKRFYKACIYCLPNKEVLMSMEGRQIMSFSSWNLLGSLGNMLVTQGIGIVFNMFYFLSVNAALGITTQVTNTIATFVNNVQLAFRPQLLQSYSKKDNDRFQFLVCNCSKWSFFLILFIAIPLICNMDSILSMWLGSVPNYTSEFVTILMFYLIIDALGNPLYYGIEAEGNIKKYQLILFVILLLNLLAAYICCMINLSPSFAIFTKLVTNVMVFLLRIFYLSSRSEAFSVKYYFLECIKPTSLVFLVALFFYYLCYDGSIICHVWISSFLYWIILLTAILLIGMNRRERLFLYKTIEAKLKM